LLTHATSAAEVQPREVRLKRKAETCFDVLQRQRDLTALLWGAKPPAVASIRIIKKQKAEKSFRFLLFSFEILPQTL
jgi:hypothetical protein